MISVMVTIIRDSVKVRERVEISGGRAGVNCECARW